MSKRLWITRKPLICWLVAVACGLVAALIAITGGPVWVACVWSIGALCWLRSGFYAMSSERMRRETLELLRQLDELMDASGVEQDG